MEAMRNLIAGVSACCLISVALPARAQGVESAELYTGASHGFGRFEARLRFAAGDGVISSFFLWKDGSEVSGNFWNELDFEKVGAECRLESNALFGKPAANHVQNHALSADLCSDFHTYAYEWTPEYIAWLVDGVELRRETGATAQAFSDNAAAGMQLRFNVWPGNASFGGNFSPSILPVRQYVDWVQYSSYKDGAFTPAWRDDFDESTLSSDWLAADWSSPKNLSKHSPANVALAEGSAVLSLTGDTTPTGGTSGTASAGAGGANGGAASAGRSDVGSGGAVTSTASAGFDNGYRPGAGCAIGAPRAGQGPGLAVALALLALRRARRRPLA
jgi:endo-1,3-1,4-beta-glycanase ExoK